ncbi:MAG TPA: hypothetical protein VK196_17900 [Magnetospirillum sp.]|nr:hypothetical protein [Magnetospirillum sp.]
MFVYRISGLTVGAEIELPGAIPCGTATAAPDVEVRLRPVPERLEGATRQGPNWEVDGENFLLRLPTIGRFLAQAGRFLDMQPEPGVDPADALPFLMGTCFGALLHQRGKMVLHASAVALNGRAYAVCGPSGAGKSTMAAALCQGGCDFIGDDIAVIDLDGGGRPLIWPDGRRLKLFDDSIRQCGLTEARHGGVRSGVAKFYVDPGRPGPDQPLPLAAIYVLQEVKPPLRESIVRLSPLDGAQTLLEQSFRPRLSLALAAIRGSRQVELTAAVLRHVPVFHLNRRLDLDQLAHTAETLRAHWRSLAG